MASTGVIVGWVIYCAWKTSCLLNVWLMSFWQLPHVSCNALLKSSDKNRPPNAHQKSFVWLVLYGTGQHNPWAQWACDYNRNFRDDIPMQRYWEPHLIAVVYSR
jgi:hypothetical protein